MFGSKNKRIQAVQVINTKPMTKSQYYAKHFGNTFIALGVIALVVLILAALIVSGVIGYNTSIVTDTNGVLDSISHPVSNAGLALINWINAHIHQLTPEQADTILSYIPTPLAGAQDFVSSDVANKQVWLDNAAQIALIVSVLTLVLSGLGIGVCAFVGKLDANFTKKEEQKAIRNLRKLEYKVAKRVTAVQNYKKNKALYSKLKSDYKAKKK